MTREEAIEKLELLRQKVDEETYRALILAIKALEQMPEVTSTMQTGQFVYVKEPCDDAISREAVLKLKHHKPEYGDMIYAFDVEQLPSVTQKSGKWIKIKSGDKDFPESIVCSRCSNENSHLDFNENAEPIGKVFVTSKFCPNCGAKMESEE